MRIQVSENRRFLVREDGSPFFYVGDTAWELFHRLDLDEAEEYLQCRTRQGFTVIQAVVLAELNGLTIPNAMGDVPLFELDPAQPNEAYFAHVDRIVRRANELGLVVAMLPTWGDKWNQKWGVGPEVFTQENAFAFGEFLGRRYQDADLIWVLGGDRPLESRRHLEITRAMAYGIRTGDEGRHLITAHPCGGGHSAVPLHQEPWLDFNMIQSGHGERSPKNYRMIEEDYARLPIKPCMDAESPYENHPIAWKPEEEGYFSDVEVRRPLYWGVFAGGHGFTYGCHEVWQMRKPEHDPVGYVRGFWYECLEASVAEQVRHLKDLMLSRPFLTRVPAPELVLEAEEGQRHVQATRDEDGSWAMVYFPTCLTQKIDLSRLRGTAFETAWFDPRSGSIEDGGAVEAGVRAFTPPSSLEEPDWVLLIDSKCSV